MSPQSPFPGQLLAAVDLGPEYTGQQVELGVDSEEANVVTSAVADGEVGHHKLVLDVDHAVKVLPSTTEGNHHLFIDHPMTWDQMLKILDALADAGVVEPGYVGASRDRGFTAVRLPWIKKAAKAEKEPYE